MVPSFVKRIQGQVPDLNRVTAEERQQGIKTPGERRGADRSRERIWTTLANWSEEAILYIEGI